MATDPVTDPTAAEAAAEAMKPNTGRTDVARRICHALGIDPDSPVSLLHWHATQQERERCARIAETAGRANGAWIADQIRRSDRL